MSIAMQFVGVNCFYFMIFAVGYFMFDEAYRISRKNYTALSIVNFLLLVTRLVARRMIDGSILYDGVIVGLSQATLGIWICISVFYLEQMNPIFVKKVTNMRITKVISNNSMYVYLGHCIFMLGVLDVFSLNTNICLKVLLWLSDTAILTAMISVADKYLQKL